MQQESNRADAIVRVSYCGIAVNVLLVICKAAVGLHAHSIAVVLDAVNNLSDALSSLITIIGAKLAGKAADRKHPYGHGRIEYISASIIALLVLLAGISSMKESFGKLLHPAETCAIQGNEITVPWHKTWNSAFLAVTFAPWQP